VVFRFILWSIIYLIIFCPLEECIDHHNARNDGYKDGAAAEKHQLLFSGKTRHGARRFMPS